MIIEMGFLQKMILYLAHPIYSAAAVIAAFLVFAGLGSRSSARWNRQAFQAAWTAVAAVVFIGVLYLLRLDSWLALTQSLGLLVPRVMITTLTIAPLALAMGLLFPLGLRRISEAVPALVS